MVRGGPRRRAGSADSHDSYDSRRAGNSGARRGRSPRRTGNSQQKSSSNSRQEPRGGQRSKYAPSLVTPTNRGGPYYPSQPAMVAQAAPFGTHQLVTYQQQQQQYHPAAGAPPAAAAHHHQLYTQQQMLSLQQGPPGSIPTQHVVAPLPVGPHVGAPQMAAHGHPHHPHMHGLPPTAPLSGLQHGLHHLQGVPQPPAHHASPAPAPAPSSAPMPTAVEPQIDAAELYRTLCSSNDEVLPAGWEKIVYNGQVIYLDHLNREAHDEHPFKMWSRAFAATQQQQV